MNRERIKKFRHRIPIYLLCLFTALLLLFIAGLVTLMSLLTDGNDDSGITRFPSPTANTRW